MHEGTIRPAERADCEALARIYNHYIRATTVTFEEQELTSVEIEDRVNETRAVGLPWLVAADGQGIVGYAYASKWKGRCAYRYSVESTIYLAAEETGRGVGTRLYDALINELRGQSMHVVIGGIALPNPASIRLHERLGFEQVAHFREVGYKFDRWIDVGYWQRTL